MNGEPISRRHALQLGLLGAGSLAIGGIGLGAQGWPPFGSTGPVEQTAAPGGRPVGARTLVEPAVVDSVDGTLDLDLRVAESEVVVGGATVRMLTYNGTVPGPTLHLRPGDRLRVRLTNGLVEPTNLHTHGLEVTPTGSSDPSTEPCCPNPKTTTPARARATNTSSRQRRESATAKPSGPRNSMVMAAPSGILDTAS